jgi:hypothetical protein
MRPSEVGGFHLTETGVSIWHLFRVTLRRLDLATEIYHLHEPHSHTRAAVRSFIAARSPNFRANTIAASASIQSPDTATPVALATAWRRNAHHHL